MTQTTYGYVATHATGHAGMRVPCGETLGDAMGIAKARSLSSRTNHVTLYCGSAAIGTYTRGVWSAA